MSILNNLSLGPPDHKFGRFYLRALTFVSGCMSCVYGRDPHFFQGCELFRGDDPPSTPFIALTAQNSTLTVLIAGQRSLYDLRCGQLRTVLNKANPPPMNHDLS